MSDGNENILDVLFPIGTLTAGELMALNTPKADSLARKVFGINREQCHVTFDIVLTRCGKLRRLTAQKMERMKRINSFRKAI